MSRAVWKIAGVIVVVLVLATGIGMWANRAFENSDTANLVSLVLGMLVGWPGGIICLDIWEDRR
jgi:predicted membrane-bound spermidine synthase